ncbi:FAD-dependent oxidoreductase [uncultured Anaerococcus sp.]|uniref:FAD-dependent oxidoreductase n=1 Tax=uncultured Anaerococcus sp. TaxID=293428 RepID=UPI00260CDBA3|nr:FAD-dependent oxidoreductase [uncultured Anaerococcus sp.]
MSDYMRPIEFEKLINWAIDEYKRYGSCFSIPKEKFYKNTSGKVLKTVFNEEISSAVGPAAGPHSQLAQNIISSYLAGARYIELKTVQVMDGEDIMKAIPKPCILSEDEAYNCEWSTELTVKSALEEYVKSHIAIQVLAKEFNLADKKDFTINMSAGYNLEGIKDKKIDDFLEGLKDASNLDVYKDSIKYLRENIDLFENVSLEDIDKIEPMVCNSITLSTMHGCPADEIESIAKYLLEEKHLHTYVKCNPTLVGYDYARDIMDKLGFAYIKFDSHHFDNDLKFEDAVKIFSELLKIGEKENLTFGVKLSNTMPVLQKKNELPSEEMYMSGRSLLPLTISVAKKLVDYFTTSLPMSYCGGANQENIYELFEIFNQPITVSTTLLKPGAYYRLKELAEVSEPLLGRDYKGVNQEKLDDFYNKLTSIDTYKKNPKVKIRDRKCKTDLTITDCFNAPCQTDGCPINQQVAAYINFAKNGDYRKAMEIIAIDNTAPSILSKTCYTFCKKACTRVDYEEGLAIRDIKDLVTSNAQEDFIKNIKAKEVKTKNKVLIIGAGPAGIGAGVFLRRNGIEVKIIEKTDKAYGYVNNLVDKDIIQKDLELALAHGVDIEYNKEFTANFDDYKEEYKYYIIATGKDTNIDIYKNLDINFNDKNPALLDTLESSKENVYFAGDILKGKKSIVHAIASAKIIAKDILTKEGLYNDFIEIPYDEDRKDIINKKAKLEKASEDSKIESKRCLSCDKICEICTEVCPNRANVSIEMEGFKDQRQIVHIDGMCNECGNCESFCPHIGKPYKDKFTVFWTDFDFENSTNTGFLKLSEGNYKIRLANKNVIETGLDDPKLDETTRRFIETIEKDYKFYLK